MISGKEYFQWFCRERLPWLAGNLLMLCFAGLAFYLCFRAFSCSAPHPAVAIAEFFLSLGCILAAALIFIRLYLHRISGFFISSLLFPKKYLENAPMVLSPIHGLIVAGDYQGAERQLLDLQDQYPGNAEIAWTLQDLYAVRMQDIDRAALAIQRYLDSRPVRENDIYFRLVMRYTEFLQGQCRFPDLKKMLKQELDRNIFTPAEAGIIQKRLENIQSQNH